MLYSFQDEETNKRKGNVKLAPSFSLMGTVNDTDIDAMFK